MLIVTDSDAFVNGQRMHILSAAVHNDTGGDSMNDQHDKADAQKQPLPDREIQLRKRHEKTADDLPETGELPVMTLAKEIPATELHDM